MAGEYTAAELLKGARAFLERYGELQPARRSRVPRKAPQGDSARSRAP